MKKSIQTLMVIVSAITITVLVYSCKHKTAPEDLYGFWAIDSSVIYDNGVYRNFNNLRTKFIHFNNHGQMMYLTENSLYLKAIFNYVLIGDSIIAMGKHGYLSDTTTYYIVSNEASKLILRTTTVDNSNGAVFVETQYLTKSPNTSINDFEIKGTSIFESPTPTSAPEVKEVKAEGGSLVFKLKEGGFFINDTKIGFTPSIDDIASLLNKEPRIVPSDNPEAYKAKGLTAQDLYVFDDLGITCMAKNGTKKCNGIGFIMQFTTGNELFPNKQFDKTIGRLQIGSCSITKEFNHKLLQSDIDFTLVSSGTKEFYYKYYGTDIYFKYDIYAAHELFKVFISLEKSHF